MPERQGAPDHPGPDRRRRLVFLSTGLSTGGAEMMLLKLVTALPGVGFDCAVVSLRDRGTIGPRITSLGVEVESLDLHRLWRLPLALPRLATLLRRFQPDLLVGWMYHGNLAATLAAPLVPGVKVVWSIRQTRNPLELERPMTRVVIRAGARWSGRPNAIIYNSAVSARQHRDGGYRARFETVIPNGFDCDLFRPRPEARAVLRNRLRLADSTPLIGLVARYHRVKGHATFFRMAGRLVASGSEAHFICAGHGVTAGNPELAPGLASESLAGRVHLLGEERDVAGLLAGLDLLCSSSSSGEAFSNVIGEAMACGVPCVVTDVGESAMIVGDTGVVAAPDDVTALADGCARLLAEAPAARARRSAAARERVQAEFSLSAVAARYGAVFREVLGASLPSQ